MGRSESLVNSRAIVSFLAKVTLWRRVNLWGQAARVSAEDWSLRQTVTASACWVMDSSCHSLRRAKPWGGADLPSRPGPNQGKQMGTPPRMGFSACQWDLEESQRTSSAWA